MRAICSQEYRPLEVIAVDDGSTDGGYEILTEWEGEHQGIKVKILKQQPLGLSAGRNLALENSSGEWVAITDIDCRPEPSWISEMYLVSSGNEGEDVFAVTGRTIFDEGETATSRLRAESIREKYSQRPRITSLANGPCSMFKRKELVRLGGFNPKWYHAEDMEVSLRIIQSGGVIIHSASAVVRHVAESSLILFLRKRRRDARAHMRIRRIFGPHGVRKPNGEIHKHDFVSDAKEAIIVFPLFLFSLSLCAGMIWWYPQESFFWWLAIIGIAICCIFFVTNKRKLLLISWSVALWNGVLLGIIDAILGIHGHTGLFQRNE